MTTSTQTIPQTILAQLGGNRFAAMTGARNFVAGECSLSFRVGRNAKAVAFVTVTLGTDDLYTVEFLGRTYTVKARAEGVYADQMAAIFTLHTDLYTSL
jgi:hypothetical protein